MSAIKLASRYAKALLDLAVEKGKVDEVHRDQLYLKKLLRQSRDFNLMLSSPLISPDRKLKAMQTVMGSKVSELTMLFLQLLVRKNREVHLKEMADSFLLQYDEYKHITQVKLTSAAPLESSQIDALISKLKQQAKLENIRLTTEVDERLVGGFVLQYGDKQYDASIAKHLGTIRKEFENNEYLKKLR